MRKLFFIARTQELLTQTQSNTVAIRSIGATGISSTLSYNQFDPGLGTLYRVEFSITKTCRSTSRVENLDLVARPGTVNGAIINSKILNVSSDILSDGDITVSFTNDLGSYDGLADYGGSSGDSNARRTASGTAVGTMDFPLDDFIGLSTYNLTVNSTATGFVTGPTLWAQSIAPEIGFTLTVYYYYIAAPFTSIVQGYIWDDIDGNGVQDIGDIGMAGVTVAVLDEFGFPVVGFPDVLTDVNGFFQFVDLPVGNYYIVVATPPGYIGTSETDMAVDGNIYVSVTNGSTTDLSFGYYLTP